MLKVQTVQVSDTTMMLWKTNAGNLKNVTSIFTTAYLADNRIEVRLNEYFWKTNTLTIQELKVIFEL